VKSKLSKRFTTTVPDPGLVLDTKALALQRRPGSMVRVTRDVPAPPDCGVALARITDPISLDLSLESVMEGIWVSGDATATVHGECARCLDPIDWQETVRLEELFAYPQTDARGAVIERDPDDEELLVVDDGIDLESPLRDALVLDLPLAPICQDDCQGLCPQCGIRLDSEPGHAHETIDPRWAALGELRDREQ
jgi:uncharacterized protein